MKTRLDSVSYYLSYTDFIPVVSIVSGIVHLICAIRDRIFGAPAPLVSPKDEDLFDLSKRKLDNWSHSTKGILAIIPLIGNFILFCKWVDRELGLYRVAKCVQKGGVAQIQKIPAQLFSDKEFLLGIFSATGGKHFGKFFARVPAHIQQDKEFVLSLINKNLCTDAHYHHLPACLQADRDIAFVLLTRYRGNTPNIFAKFPEALRNDPQVIAATLAAGDPYYVRGQILEHITNRERLKVDKELYRAAVRKGIFTFKELEPQHQQDFYFALQAVLYDPSQFQDLPTSIQEDCAPWEYHLPLYHGHSLEYYKLYKAYGPKNSP
jgi:hypothetical protein